MALPPSPVHTWRCPPPPSTVRGTAAPWSLMRACNCATQACNLVSKAKQMIDQFDADADGELSRDEFQTMLAHFDRCHRSLPPTAQVANAPTHCPGSECPPLTHTHTYMHKNTDVSFARSSGTAGGQTTRLLRSTGAERCSLAAKRDATAQRSGRRTHDCRQGASAGGNVHVVERGREL